jgi:hypothetical protein
LRRSLRRRLRRVLPVGLVVAAFVLALSAWVLSGRTKPDDAGAIQPASPGASALGTIPTAPITGPATGTATSGTSTVSPGARSTVVPPGSLTLPGGSTVDVQSGSAHRVTINVESDSSIHILMFLVRGGNPAQGKYTQVRSPVTISTIGHGDGLLAEAWVQSSIYATTTSCTITIDGTVRSHHTASGPYNVAVCIA